MAQKWTPTGDVGSAGGWTAQSGSDLYAMVDDDTASNSTYIQATDDSYANKSCIVSLEDLDAPADGDIKLYYTAKSTNDSFSGTLSLKLELLGDGSSQANLTQSLSTSFTDYTSGDLIDYDDISDWDTAQIKITMLQGMGVSETIQLSNVYLLTEDGSGGGGSVPIAAIAMNTDRQMGN